MIQVLILSCYWTDEQPPTGPITGVLTSPTETTLMEITVSDGSNIMEIILTDPNSPNSPEVSLPDYD